MENAKQWCLFHLNARREVKNEQKSPKICRKYIEDIQVLGVNMSFISLSEVKNFYECRRHEEI